MKGHAMPLAILAIAMLALLPSSLASQSRSLLQGSQCQPLASSLINDCNQFLGLVQAQANNLATATDAQIQQFVAGKTPPPTCCNTVKNVLSAGCRCDPTVASIAASVGIQPSGFLSLSRAGIIACNLPPTTDTAPKPCPASSSAGK